MARKNCRSHRGRSKFYQGLIEALSIYARQQVELSKPEKDGASLRSHLESVQRQTGITPEQLAVDELPDCIAHVWLWFCQLSPKRAVGMAAGPIASLEIEAWARLHRIEMTPFEVTALEALDTVYLQAQAKEQKT